MPSNRIPSLSRREFVAAGAAVAAGASPIPGVEAPQPRQATGVKIGEVTDSAAIMWVRLTSNTERNADGTKLVGKVTKDDTVLADADVRMLNGACPGMAGRMCVRYGANANLSNAKATDWVEVTEKTDFTHQFTLAELAADTIVHYAVETTGPQKVAHGTVTGSFRTAPKPDAEAEITFAVVTCQMYADLDHVDGFNIYPAMKELAPRFVAFTGDNVYYDNERPRALTPALARYHWERMYSLSRHLDLLRSVATYWEKDDHDCLKDDSWPGQKMGELTFAEGQRIFRQQVPLGDTIYRTFRWGKFLQVWFTDGRDFRSPNTMKDGPEKSIWGKEQKAWLFRTLQESAAVWKVIVTPTPLVGPDRGNKSDNHANKGFQTEGDEIRAWLQKHAPTNTFSVCGDRHWQYHSVHPKTGLHEFSIGAASDRHASGSPGEDKNYHKFHRVKGGFLTVTARAKSILFQHRDVHGKVVYEYEAKTG